MASISQRSSVALTFDVSSLDCPAVAVDARRRIISWNAPASRLLGFQACDVVGADCCDTLLAQQSDLHTLDRKWLSAVCGESRRNVQPSREVVVAAADGEDKWVLVSALPAWTVTGERVTICLLHETTPYHRLAPRPERVEDEERTPPRLTARESEVLALLGCGLSTPDIAKRLGITGVTARNHVAHLMEKLGAETRLQAVVIGARLGLI